jgi:ribosomal protein L19E
VISLGSNSKSGGNSRKIGRASRKPAHVRYNNEMRWIRNKIKKIKKQEKFEAKKAKKLNR